VLWGKSREQEIALIIFQVSTPGQAVFSNIRQWQQVWNIRAQKRKKLRIAASVRRSEHKSSWVYILF
jgi:hypothetical protein